MPDNYFRAFDVDEIVSHAQLFRRFLLNLYVESGPPLRPIISWQPYPQKGHSSASICTWDSAQLLAKIAGSFSVVPLNILGADIYTRGDNVVLDTFRVCDLNSRAVTDESQFALFDSTLRKALTDPTFDFGPMLDKARQKAPLRPPVELEFPTKIITDNKAHPAYTLIQIETPDRFGLLFDLLSVFGREGVSISLSRISTEKGGAIDTFYVVDSSTRGKITDSSRIAALQEALQRTALLLPSAA